MPKTAKGNAIKSRDDAYINVPTLGNCQPYVILKDLISWRQFFSITITECYALP